MKDRSDAADAVWMTSTTMFGAIVWTRGTVDWKSDAAHLVGAAAPWVLAVGVVGLASAVVLRLIRRKASRKMFIAVIGGWRARWRHRRRWRRMAMLHGLTVSVDDRVLYPRLNRVFVKDGMDVLRITMVPGQNPDQWRRCSDALAHAYRAESARIHIVRPSMLDVELHYRDALAEPVRLPVRLLNDDDVESDRMAS